MDMTCYYCGIELTQENRTREHIIPEALGGRLTSSEILCRTHNSILGRTVDIQLFERLKFAAV